MSRVFLSTALVMLSASLTSADVLRVPQGFSTIQAAIDAARAGDEVVVAAGTYRERIVVRRCITVRSAGPDTRGRLGLLRAERTVIDGSGVPGERPGVTMAEGAILDGFTVTGVGRYDDELWRKHHATRGDEQNHKHIGAPGTPGIRVRGVNCGVRNNIVHHNGYSGVAIEAVGGRPCTPVVSANVCYRNMGGGIGIMKQAGGTIRKNICFENFYAGIGHDDASPLVIENRCYANIRAGIGISEGACPVVRGNRCYQNRRAGIGVRTKPSTRPVIEGNDCFENDMAGIGTEDEAAALIRNNRCYRNRLAGIGSRTRATPTIIGNECYENGTVGIGQQSDAQTRLIDNHCHDNKEAGIGFSACDRGRSVMIRNRVINNGKVAVGIQAGWSVTAVSNELSREGGLPPIVMVFSGARAVLTDNTIRGSGVAGVRVAGDFTGVANTFVCPSPRAGGPPNNAIWALPGSKVSQSANTFRGWRTNVAGVD